MKIKMVFFYFVCGFLPVLADDITTLDGKTYKNAKIISHDPATITILYTEGGARIDLANLSPDLRKKYGYNADTAQSWKDQQAQQKALADAASKERYQEEVEQQNKEEQAEIRRQKDARDATEARRMIAAEAAWDAQQADSPRRDQINKLEGESQQLDSEMYKVQGQQDLNSQIKLAVLQAQQQQLQQQIGTLQAQDPNRPPPHAVVGSVNQ